MRKFFEPSEAPIWLKAVLTSIRQALGDPWGRPLRLEPFATTDLPTTTDLGASAGAIAWDETASKLACYDGSAWQKLQPVSGLAPSATTDTTNASNITSGTLAVARGGTGATSTTGTGANVLAVGPALTGSVTMTQSSTGGHTVTSQGVVLHVNSSNSNASIIDIQTGGTSQLFLGGDGTEGFRVADGSGTLRFSCTLGSTPVVKLNGTQVLTSRRTGWTAPTGTATRTGFATSTATTTQLAEALKALIDDLTTHGLIGA